MLQRDHISVGCGAGHGVKSTTPGDPRWLPADGPVAQLDRASDFGSEGWGFDSLRGRHSKSGLPLLSNPRISLPARTASTCTLVTCTPVRFRGAIKTTLAERNMGRLFGFVGTIVTMAIGMYIYSLQVGTLTPGAGNSNSEEVATITGVKNDLIGIANAERGYLASQGKYASLDELISGNYLSIKGERPPYIYDVETTSSSFRATATRTTKGAPAQLWVNETMQVQASD